MRLLALLLFLVSLGASASQLPILFVHGNGDSAAIWETVIWRFESNGYDPKLLSAIDFTHPTARDADHVAQANRSSTADQLAELTAAIDKVLSESGQRKLVLVASSRGGNSVRNFIKHGGKDKVALAVLCGTPNHGVFFLPYRFDMEFNGMGPFLRDLNDPETVPGVRYATLRSDHNDKFAQPFGGALGMPYLPTFISSAGPELKGAENIVLPGLDHREVAFHKLAFAQIYQEVTGTAPETLDFAAEPSSALSGMISGWDNGAPTNLPLADAKIAIYQVDPATGERMGEAQFTGTSGADGRWGPFTAMSSAYYEFVVSADGYPTTHSYRTPFARSSRYVYFRLAPLPAGDGALVTLNRARGYMARDRDSVEIDGKTPDAVTAGVPMVSSADRSFPATPSRSISVRFNEESLAVRTFPLSENQRVIAELHN
jgi:pimeloyl-ACP methyl ester carboxylesterase